MVYPLIVERGAAADTGTAAADELVAVLGALTRKQPRLVADTQAFISAMGAMTTLPDEHLVAVLHELQADVARCCRTPTPPARGRRIRAEE